MGGVSPLAVNLTGTLSITASDTLNANRGITIAANGTGRINVATGANTVTYGGNITGPGKFIKMGDGTVVAGGTHSHAGGTDVYGRLIMDGSSTGTAAFAVKTASALGGNGTLGGTGSIAGPVTVESGASIAPGAVGGIGTLSLNGDLTLGAGSLLAIDLGAPTTGDRINVAGTTTINGGTVNVTDAGGLATGIYTILDYAGALGGSFSNLTLGTVPAGFTINLVDTGSLINLDVTGAAAGLLGDFNEDGKVDAADYVVYRKNVGGGPLPNDDGLGSPVGPAHYNLWVAHFGEMEMGGGSGVGAAPVPEPASLALLMFGLAAIAFGRRGR
jgi:hypothetical protein